METFQKRLKALFAKVEQEGIILDENQVSDIFTSIYQQAVIDTYSKIGFAKLHDRKNALVSADMLNDRVIPFFEQA